MQAEIISVGTELLLGRIVNTNAKYIAAKLADIGIESRYQTTIGDNLEHIKEAMAIANQRNDLIIVSGGLGPTQDDMTKQAVAEFLNTKLMLDKVQLERIKRRFDERGRNFVESNIKQAQYLNGSEILPNYHGLALGDFYRNDNGADIILLPGPPTEMEPMMNELILSVIKNYHLKYRLISKVMKFYGISESQLMSELSDLVGNSGRVSIASYAKKHEIWLRLTILDNDSDDAQIEIDAVKLKIAKRYPDFYYSDNIDETLAMVVVKLLKAKNKAITAAESLTAGMFQSTIASVPGASNVFSGGFVTYSNQVKTQMLNIPSLIIKQNGVVSEQVATSMAENAKVIMNADIGISFTGVAGPDSLEGNPVGTVWIGLAGLGMTVAQKLQFASTDSRTAIREKSVLEALRMLWIKLRK
ncbi:competence damage-inducible protein A [Paucilactobacillus oligofermentans DSM 15707 = LMG 22743]|uniref:Putative competence-damage inducible protein n=1 Tax=Paucilactobacillus oligofermentans DSM 15707 = LMG 22743 TaxID=1423778 RepID=A0A0R1RM16_9LACO|nr:competence/damage-inducible protein A [Paucilactobacillus oligofermentans]KRL57959.1 competence damage-inducible protein A [Paucilactobacillus oligofermentans DSM 15707 = LMG 22743]CUS26569.1 Competence-damage inducible protein [Paucilactobacillus oligofermentans DSM 15707 = LMG 22743]